MVAILARDDVGEESGSGQSLLDGLGGFGGLGHFALAAPAGVFGPHVLDDVERGGHVFQLLVTSSPMRWRVWPHSGQSFSASLRSCSRRSRGRSGGGACGRGRRGARESSSSRSRGFALPRLALDPKRSGVAVSIFSDFLPNRRRVSQSMRWRYCSMSRARERIRAWHCSALSGSSAGIGTVWAGIVIFKE